MDTTQVETDRLLTDEEIQLVWVDAITEYRHSRCMTEEHYIKEQKYACKIASQDQDAKTLKAVGEWLEEKPKDFIRDGTDAFTVEVSVEEIHQLKQGKLCH